MARRIIGKDGWKWFRIVESRRSFCTNNNTGRPMILENSEKIVGHDGTVRDLEAYKNLHNLDFMTAAKILFSAPTDKKKFGFDFHMVQFFFACMPSLAVYFVAQYARHDIKKMEAELEVKKKAEDKKTKEMELIAAEEEEMKSNSKLLEVKVRLDKLEEALKEIAVHSKKENYVGSRTQNQEDGSDKKPGVANEPTNSQHPSQTRNSSPTEKNSQQGSAEVT